MRNISSCAPCYRFHRKRCLCLWNYACHVCPLSLTLFHLTVTVVGLFVPGALGSITAALHCSGERNHKRSTSCRDLNLE